MGRREELGSRIRDAVDKHSNNGSYSEMAQYFFGLEVAAHERAEPYTPGVVQGWMYGSILPSLDTLRAMRRPRTSMEQLWGFGGLRMETTTRASQSTRRVISGTTMLSGS